jgi:hypothetical protein
VTSWPNEAKGYHCSATIKTRQTSNTSKHFLMDDWRILGEKFGLGYCEAFRYMVPLRTTAKTLADMLTSIPFPSSKGAVNTACQLPQIP